MATPLLFLRASCIMNVGAIACAAAGLCFMLLLAFLALRWLSANKKNDPPAQQTPEEPAKPAKPPRPPPATNDTADESPDAGFQSGSCKLSYYGPEPSANDGFSTTADGSPLDHTKNIVAVGKSKWNKLKGKKVRIGNKTYTIRDQCSVCDGRKVDYDVLVESEARANSLGLKTMACSIDPKKV